MTSTEVVTQAIELIIAPVVMITSCALLLNGILARYAIIESRLQEAYGEKLGLSQQERSEERGKAKRITLPEQIIPDLLRHHHLLHEGLERIYYAILIFMFDMLAIAVSVLTAWPWINQFVVFIFLIGLAVLLWGLVYIAQEIRISHVSVQLDVDRMCSECEKHGVYIRRQ
jgi:Flp pilus assembly protein TadB